MGTRSIYRELGQHHAPLVRPLGEASRRAEPEPASGRASKLWLPTARVVDIGYCGYSEPFGGAGEGHTGLRLGLASPYPRIRDDSVGKGLTPFPRRRFGGMAENGISLPFARGALPRPSRCSHRSIRSPGGSENGRRHFPAIFLWIASPPRRVLGSWSGCEINR